MIDWIFFDLDGVLVDSRKWHYDAIQGAFAKEGLYLTWENHENVLDGLPTKRKLEILALQYNLTNEQVIRISKLKQEMTIEIFHKNLHKDNNLISVLQNLQTKNIRMAVCSNAIRSTVEICLNKLGILDFFDFYLSSEDVELPKPDPEIYIKALSVSGSLPQRTLIIEDSPHGLLAARASNCKVLSVKNSKDWDLNSLMEYV